MFQLHHIFILLLYNKFGVNNKGELNVHLTRKEIGELANATTETAIREISKLKKEGIINIKGKELILKKIDKRPKKTIKSEFLFNYYKINLIHFVIFRYNYLIYKKNTQHKFIGCFKQTNQI